MQKTQNKTKQKLHYKSYNKCHHRNKINNLPMNFPNLKVEAGGGGFFRSSLVLKRFLKKPKYRLFKKCTIKISIFTIGLEKVRA